MTSSEACGSTKRQVRNAAPEMVQLTSGSLQDASRTCPGRVLPAALYRRPSRPPGGEREEVKGPPDRNLAKVVWVARVAPQARAEETAAKLGAERLLGAQAAVLFRLEARHLPVCRRLAREQQEVERRRRGVECVERHVRAGRRRRGRREGEEDELDRKSGG